MSPAKWTTRTSIIVETVIAMIAIAGLTVALVAVVISANASQRDLKRQQDSLCGLVVPISGIAPAPHQSDLALTLITNAGKAAAILDCPGVSK